MYCSSALLWDQNLCLSSAVASRLISLGAAFRDTLTVVVPECHSRHVNRFCYLLTYLLTYFLYKSVYDVDIDFALQLQCHMDYFRA